MSMHKSGRNDTITPGASCMYNKPKLTFEYWWQRCYEVDNLYLALVPYKKHFLNCWETAQDNVK